MRALLAIALVGCTSASGDPGLDAEMQLSAATPGQTAQYNPGAMPGDGAGPKIITIDVSLFTVVPGAVGQPLLGTLEAGATAFGCQLAGDRGWWLLPAGVPDANSPTLPSFAALMSFARTLPPGPVTLVARAINVDGQFGPASTVMLTVADVPPDTTGLVVSLKWDSPTDLDLHVVDPSGVEIWADAPTSPSGGTLDLDSNSNCVIDGRDQEDATWSQPPSGHYDVRVDTFSLCGQPVADWQVTVTLDGVSLGSAGGQAIPADTLGTHQRGSGREVLGFDVP